jgi:predicted dehydrogenase
MKLKAAVVGFGNRGEIYASFALQNPDLLEIVAVVEPDEKRRVLAQEQHKISDELAFLDIVEFLAADLKLDFVINATMDSLHYQTTIGLLYKGYNVLLEKPVTSDEKELRELAELSKKNGCKLSICHVLRYSPFYSGVKQLVLNGAIGEIMHIETNESIGIPHFLCAYVRGKWRNSKQSGSSLLLAKCCHDLDLLCWLNDTTVPETVQSFGGRNYFVGSKAPKGAGTRCLVDCPHVETCIYSAKKISVENNLFPYYVFIEKGSDFENIPKEERIEILSTYSDFGICAYKTDSDLVDHQTVSIHFANGSTATHSMIGGVARPARKLHIIGTKAEIEGVLDQNKYTLRSYDENTGNYKTTEFVIDDSVLKSSHFGSDDKIVADFVKYISGQPRSISSTDIDASVHSHLCVYAADKSMEENKVISL